MLAVRFWKKPDPNIPLQCWVQKQQPHGEHSEMSFKRQSTIIGVVQSVESEGQQPSVNALNQGNLGVMEVVSSWIELIMMKPEFPGPGHFDAWLMLWWAKGNLSWTVHFGSVYGKEESGWAVAQGQKTCIVCVVPWAVSPSPENTKQKLWRD